MQREALCALNTPHQMVAAQQVEHFLQKLTLVILQPMLCGNPGAGFFLLTTFKRSTPPLVSFLVPHLITMDLAAIGVATPPLLSSMAQLGQSLVQVGNSDQIFLCPTPGITSRPLWGQTPMPHQWVPFSLWVIL